MVASALAVGEAVGTYQNFYLSTVFFGYLFQRLKIVVPVVVKHNKAVVLFKLLDERLQTSYLLAGGGGELVIGVICPQIVFHDLSVYDSLVKAIVSQLNEPVAETVAHMLLSEQGIGEGKAAGDTSLVEFIENVGNGTLIGIAVDISSAVLYSGGEAAVNGSYLHTVTEILGVLLYHINKCQIKRTVAPEIRQMEFYTHYNCSFLA